MFIGASMCLYCLISVIYSYTVARQQITDVFLDLKAMCVLTKGYGFVCFVCLTKQKAFMKLIYYLLSLAFPPLPNKITITNTEGKL